MSKISLELMNVQKCLSLLTKYTFYYILLELFERVFCVVMITFYLTAQLPICKLEIMHLVKFFASIVHEVCSC